MFDGPAFTVSRQVSGFLGEQLNLFRSRLQGVVDQLSDGVCRIFIAVIAHRFYCESWWHEIKVVSHSRRPPSE